MDSQFDIQNIGKLIKQSNEDFKAFKIIREKFVSAVSSDEFSDFLQALTNNLHQFTANNVKKLLLDNSNTRNWMTSNNPIISMNMINLYVTCITYFPNFVNEICELYVNQVFYLKDFIEQLNGANYSNLNNIAVEFFATLCHNVPQTVSIIVDLLIKRFPNWRKPVKELIWATYSISFFLSNSKSSKLLTPTHKCAIISVILTAIIDLELNPDGIQCENLLASFENTTVNMVFQKFDKSVLEEKLGALFDTIQDFVTNDKNWLKLELICWLFVSYISSICTIETNDSSSRELNWDLLCSVFRCARDLFSEHILPVNICLIAYPMICFYMCSLRGGLAVNFADFLWTVVKNNHRDQVSRLMALSYLCFLLVHGKFCFVDLIIEILHDIATWCVDYTYRNRNLLTSTHSNALLSENKIYYATCNVLVYIFVQLHSELLSPKYFESCNRLPMAQISISPFKPLLYMPMELRQTFFRIISAYHLSWSIIGLTQSINDRDTFKNDTPLTVKTIESLTPSNIIHIPKNTCSLSLSSLAITCLFRQVNLGKRLIINQQVDNSTNHSKSVSISSSSKKRKANLDT
ncbi:RNA polymerase I-specific transcription initiation factor RRN3 [Schistosoma japonicum]|nr:RNA polymerase I-specific transcription initiation factor RRN3 [Schistosoma japonicum]